MNDRIKFGDNPQWDSPPIPPRPTIEKQNILTNTLGLPDTLTGKSVLELFSGDTNSSFKVEVLSRGGSYDSVDKHESTGLGHYLADVYQKIEEFPPQSFHHVIMSGPLIWGRSIDEQQWKRENSTRFATHNLIDADNLMKFLATCTKLIIPGRGNGISIAGGFTNADYQEILRRASTSIPRYSEWYIHSPLTGNNTEVIIMKKRGGIARRLPFPEQALQLKHY